VNAKTETTTAAEAANAVAAATLLGTLVTVCIDEIKAARDVWPKLSEDDQCHIIKRVTSQVGDAVRDAVRVIASEGRDVIAAELEQITAKDGIKAVCTLVKHDPNRHALLDAVGRTVLLVVAGADPFMGGDIPKADPDQQELPIADNCPATTIN
jgi:hypothetical protein